MLPSFYNKDNINKLYSVDRNWVLNESLKNRSYSEKSNICVFVVGPQVGILNDRNKNVFIGISELIYENCGSIEDIFVFSFCSVFIQIFHPVFWLSKENSYPPVGTTIHFNDVREGKWKINPIVGKNLNNIDDCKNFVFDYLEKAESIGHRLVIKPFNHLISSLDSAIIPLVDEAVFYYSCMKGRQVIYEYELFSPLGEYQSFFSPVGKHLLSGSLLLKSKYSILGLLKRYDKIFFVGEKRERIIYSINDIIENYSLSEDIHKKLYILNDLSVFSEDYNVEEINKIIVNKKINIISSKDAFKKGIKR